MLTTAQRQKMFGMAKQLNMLDKSGDTDMLHELISNITGKDSIKQLTTEDYKAVVAELSQRMKISHLQPPPRKRNDTAKGVTAGQQSKIWYLMYQLKDCDIKPVTSTLGERLCGIIKKELHIDAQAKNPFVWLSFQQANKLIEILKNYCRNAERKKMRSG